MIVVFCLIIWFVCILQDMVNVLWKEFIEKENVLEEMKKVFMIVKFYVYRLQVFLNKISNDGLVLIINFEDFKMENERLQSEFD